MSARTDFQKVYHTGQPNLMTPRVVRYGRRGSKVYELSVGDSILRDGGELWGVTFVDSVAKKKLHDLSKCFPSKADAERYIREA